MKVLYMFPIILFILILAEAAFLSCVCDITAPGICADKYQITKLNIVYINLSDFFVAHGLQDPGYNDVTTSIIDDCDNVYRIKNGNVKNVIDIYGYNRVYAMQYSRSYDTSGIINIDDIFPVNISYPDIKCSHIILSKEQYNELKANEKVY
jgi:hypothetical protein